jgi:hypothetical protein
LAGTETAGVSKFCCEFSSVISLVHALSSYGSFSLQDKDAACYYVLFLPILQEAPVMAFDVSVCYVSIAVAFHHFLMEMSA